MNRDIYKRILAGETVTYVLERQALWRLSGPDRERYLNGQVTLDVSALVPDEARLAAVCTAKGRMEGAVRLASHDDAFFIDAEPSLQETLGPRLEKYLIADDATFESISDEWTLSHVFGNSLPQFENGFAVKSVRFGPPGHDVWTAGPAATVIGARAEADEVEAIRIEYGLPRWGADLTTHTLPPEAGPHMLSAISYSKGCYVGQETIARLKSIGHVNRTLTLLQADGAEIDGAATKLSVGEKEVGVITSRCFSPRREKGIALAYLSPTLAAEGSVVQAGPVSLTVAAPLGL